MEYKITGCKPEKLFHFFEDISAIPRGSGNEKGLSDYLVKFAKDRNLWVYQDESNNVIIKKEGSEGAKDKAPVMLQGHIDMVCDKLAGVEHDFEKDGEMSPAVHEARFRIRPGYVFEKSVHDEKIKSPAAQIRHDHIHGRIVKP